MMVSLSSRSQLRNLLDIQTESILFFAVRVAHLGFDGNVLSYGLLGSGHSCDPRVFAGEYCDQVHEDRDRRGNMQLAEQRTIPMYDPRVRVLLRLRIGQVKSWGCGHMWSRRGSIRQSREQYRSFPSGGQEEKSAVLLL